MSLIVVASPDKYVQTPQIQFSTRASDGFLAIDFPFSLRHHATRASLRGSLAKFLSFTSSPRERQSNTEYSILVKAAGIVDVGFCLTFFCHNLLSKYLCTTYEPKFCYRTTYAHNNFVTHHYYRTGLCFRPFVPAAFGPGTIGGFCPGSNG